MGAKDLLVGKLRKLAGFAYICFLVLWICGYAFLLAKLIFKNALLFQTIDNAVKFNNYVLFYAGGLIVRAGQGHLLFDPATEWQYFNQVVSPAAVSQQDYFEMLPTFYFPTYYAVMALFTFLPMTASFVVWTVISLAIGWFGLGTLFADRMKCTLRETILFLIGVTATLPSWIIIRDGHSCWMMIGFCSLFLYFLLNGRQLMSGIFLAIVASLKPQYALFLVLPLLAQSRWKALVAFVIGVAAIIGSAIVISGVPALLSYPRILTFAEHSTKLAGSWAVRMVSIRGLLTHFLPQPLVFQICFFATLATALVLLFLWVKVRKSSDRQLINFALAVTVVAPLLPSPHSHNSDCLLLSVAAALTLPTLSLFSSAQLKPLSLRVWSFLLLLCPIINCILFELWEFNWQDPSPFLAIDLTLFVSGLAYLIWHLNSLKAERQQSRS